MKEWFNSLVGISQTYFIIAISATIIMLIMLILQIIGIGDNDMDGDLSDVNDGDFLTIFGLRILTLRGVLAFFAIGGWVGLIFLESIKTVWISVLLSIVFGLIAMLIIALIMRKLNDLEVAGNIQLNNCIGQIGIVYLTIPKNGEGTGKVSILIQERYIEVEAITYDILPIKTSEEVSVKDVVNNILVVERVNK